jgi:uncharacterized protein YprB with RNaseH-like and TPR domain
MATFNERLSRLAALRPAKRQRIEEEDFQRRTPVDSDALAHRLGAVVRKNRHGEHLLLQQWFSSPEPCDLHPEALRLLLPAKRGAEEFSPALRERLCDPSQWLFLDTETTGLAGGTGTYAFLIGLAWWESGGLQVEQLFMRDYGEEHSLLVELAARMASRRVLVTFNGKSFDWPLLETRYAMTRSLQPRRPEAHLDLLHTARALWKLRLGSVRLTELERHVLDAPRLGWRRDHDIDSSFIPQFYFDYLRGGSSEPLAGVFRHNQMDLRGLAALAGKVLSLLADSDPHAVADDPLDIFGLSRLVQRRGQTSRARLLYQSALDAGLPCEAGCAARRELALLAKREGDFERATALWNELAENPQGDPREALRAFEQLAIYFEHRAKDPLRAAELTRKALALLSRAKRSRWTMFEQTTATKLDARFRRRLARVERLGRLGRPAARQPRVNNALLVPGIPAPSSPPCESNSE